MCRCEIYKLKTIYTKIKALQVSMSNKDIYNDMLEIEQSPYDCYTLLV